MRYKVWVEIEGVPEAPEEEEQPNGGYVNAGELGVLPDPLGEFSELDEARGLVAEVVRVFNPVMLATSDAVEKTYTHTGREGEHR